MNPAFQDEVQFLAWGDGPQGPWIKLKLPDSDDLGPFRGMTQAKATMAGQRMACVLVEIGEDERPRDPFIEGNQWTPEQREAMAARGAAPFEPNRIKGGELSKCAGQLCASTVFHDWLQLHHFQFWMDAIDTVVGDNPVDIAAEAVRQICGVTSRAHLDHAPLSATKFHEQIRRPFAEGRAP